jgi:glycerophosphoryl diester phosphodiesterase
MSRFGRRLQSAAAYAPFVPVTVADIEDSFIFWNHRGSPDVWPEASMTAYRASPLSVATGAHPTDVIAMETDQCYLSQNDPVTGDNYIVMNHDTTTARTWENGSSSPISGMTKAQWDAGRIPYPVGAIMPPGTPAVPASYMSEMLDAYGGRRVIAIEGKVSGATAMIIAEITRRNLKDSVVYASFSGSDVDTAIAAGIKTIQSYSTTLPNWSTVAARGVWGVSILSGNADVATIDAIHAEGIRVFPYQNVTTASRVALMRSRGADGVNTDNVVVSVNDAGVQWRDPATPLPWE